MGERTRAVAVGFVAAKVPSPARQRAGERRDGEGTDETRHAFQRVTTLNEELALSNVPPLT